MFKSFEALLTITKKERVPFMLGKTDAMEIQHYGQFIFQFEEEEKQMTVWVSRESKEREYGEPLSVVVKGGDPDVVAFRMFFPLPQNYWEKSTKILAHCKKFAKDKTLREVEFIKFKAWTQNNF